MKKHEQLANRLGLILQRLNSGERLDVRTLAEEFDCSLRTLQRDMKERLTFLDWLEFGPYHYQINRQSLGILTHQDIQRFARFASVNELFPEVDRGFYQEKLIQSIQIKGFEYENIQNLQAEFKLLQDAIEQHKVVHFQYVKSGQKVGKFYQIEPYALINKNGIWYLIGQTKQERKTFCFTQISMLRMLDEVFEPNTIFLKEISENDSIYFGSQLNEIVVQVANEVAPYFLRRNLLPNQTLLHKLDNGDLLLSCKKVNEREVVPLVQYWIPYLTIISPAELQQRMLEKLRNYLTTP